MTRWACGLIFLMAVAGPMRAAEPIVILIGLDGFRADYLEKFRPPVLSQLASGGVRAQRMVASFPTLTFPNFYTIATGLRPEHHGIINNRMYDPVLKEKFSLGSESVMEAKWWGGEPIWNTAEKQGIRAACMFWPGSEAPIGNRRPSEWRKYDETLPPDERVQTVLDWLARPEGERPRLVTLYFHEADTAGHRFGVDSMEVGEAVQMVDRAIGKLVAGVRQLGLANVTNFVVVADHGMTALSPDRVIALSSMVDLNNVQVDFSGPVAGLRPLTGTVEDLYAKLAAGAEHYKVYRREEMPKRLHFRASDRIPPIVMIADEGWLIFPEPPGPGRRLIFQKAGHGFDPALASMGATFVAWGPAFRKGAVIGECENVDVYNLVCRILKLKPAGNDGGEGLADRVLRIKN